MYTPRADIPPQQTTTAADGTHPSGMHSCYRPQRSCGQGNIFTPVCHSVHRGGSASMHAGIPPPLDQTPPWDQAAPPRIRPPPRDQADPPQIRPPLGPGRPPRTRQTPPDQTPPPQDQADPPGTWQTPPWDLVDLPPPGKQTPAYGLRAAGTHPTGMHSCSLMSSQPQHCRSY